MLYGTPSLEAIDKAVLGEIEEMRRDLRYRLAETHRWDDQLRRQLQARAIQGSNSIEGYRAGVEDIESVPARRVAQPGAGGQGPARPDGQGLAHAVRGDQGPLLRARSEDAGDQG